MSASWRAMEENQVVATRAAGDVHLSVDTQDFQTTLSRDQQLGESMAPCHVIHDSLCVDDKEL